MSELYYVYALLDPRKFNAPFYVGKGLDDRCYQHLNGRCEGENRFKDHVIGAIRKKGLEPTIKLLVENINDENEAYKIETWYIRLWGRRNINLGGILTNICLDKNPPNMKGSKRTKKQRECLKGRIPWNKGLTKETDDRVKHIGIQNSEHMQNNIPWNKGLDKTDHRVQKYIQNIIPFKKGNIPWNKGTKGIMKANSGCFGNRPAWNKMNLSQEFIDAIIFHTGTQVQIAKEYEISQSLVSLIKKGIKVAG